VPRFHCLTFLTDYGLGDAFVGVCHGVASRITPDLRIVDITHLIPRGDIQRGAVVLAQATPYFPPAVHVAVVDPGVGTARRAVAVEAGGSLFVGPDNGLLAAAIAQAGGAGRAVSLTNAAHWLENPAATFHGRDIFMPVAARLASGMPLDEAGDPVAAGSLVTLPPPDYRITDGTVHAEVVSVDGYGNVQLSLPGPDAPGAGLFPGASVAVSWDGGAAVLPFVATFGEVAPGEPLCYRDGGDWVAVAVSGGDAARLLGLRTGTKVTLTPC
jgi:S-adenosyl-L-methionine hydrolase (adenosine-forming)